MELGYFLVCLKFGPRLNSFKLLFSCLSVLELHLQMWGSDCPAEKVLQAVLNMYSITEHLFTEVCIIVDKLRSSQVAVVNSIKFQIKLGKLSREEIEKELISTELSSEAVQGIIEVFSLKSLSKLEEVLGSGVEAVADLKKLF